MKRTKKIVAVAIAVLLVLSVSSIAMAAQGDSNTDTSVKVEVKEPVTKQISATVPLEMAIALQKQGSSGTVTVPTNYAITNTSKEAAAADAAIRVTAVSAMSPMGSGWSLATTPVASKQLKLGFGTPASYFPDLAAGATSKVYLDNIPTELTNIAKDSSVVIPISATAAFGTDVNDTAAASAEAYKVSFTIAPQDVTKITATVSTTAITAISPAPATAAGNKNLYQAFAAGAAKIPNIGNKVNATSTDWKDTSGELSLTQGNVVVVLEVTADNRVVRVSEPISVP